MKSDEESQWYDHEEEMKELSEKFPDVLFKLHGEDEDKRGLLLLYRFMDYLS